MVYEDFTTYTEFDEGSDITVDSATKVSWNTLITRKETGYLYKDKGIDHFASDFNHKFEIQFNNASRYNNPRFWVLANDIGDFYSLTAGGKDAYGFYLYNDSEQLGITILENGSQRNDGWPAAGPQSLTTYYIEIIRDDDGGANNTGMLTVYIRTESHTGTLRDTLTLDCAVGEQNDFRYIYSISTSDDNHSYTGSVDGFTQNLDTGEVPVGWTGKIASITNPAKINGVAVADIAKVMGR